MSHSSSLLPVGTSSNFPPWHELHSVILGEGYISEMLGQAQYGSWGFSIKIFLVASCGSAGKEYACNVGDLGLIPGWEDPLEKGKTTHSSIMTWKIPQTVVHEVARSQTLLRNFHSLTLYKSHTYNNGYIHLAC